VQEFLPPEILAAIASQYRRAGTAAVRNYETQKADEDSLTGALGASLAMVEGEAAAHGVRYTWRTLSWKVRGRGPGAPESINGADAFLTFEVLDADGKFLRTKALPVQAKKIWDGKDSDLVEQVRKMQSLYGASLVVDFRPEGYFAFEGDDVLAADGRRKDVPPDRIKALGDLLADDFLTCKIGAIGLRYDDTVKSLRDASASTGSSRPRSRRSTPRTSGAGRSDLRRGALLARAAHPDQPELQARCHLDVETSSPAGRSIPALREIFQVDGAPLSLYKHQEQAIALAAGRELRRHHRHRLRQVALLLHPDRPAPSWRRSEGRPHREPGRSSSTR
jgi:hypothetical protein